MAELPTVALSDLLTQAGCTQALLDVAKERARQVSEEAWTAEHDDRHGAGQLVMAALAYAVPEAAPWYDLRLQWWPWRQAGFKPKDRRRDLVRAGALILAEIERIDRAQVKADG